MIIGQCYYFCGYTCDGTAYQTTRRKHDFIMITTKIIINLPVLGSMTVFNGFFFATDIVVILVFYCYFLILLDRNIFHYTFTGWNCDTAETNS